MKLDFRIDPGKRVVALGCDLDHCFVLRSDQEIHTPSWRAAIEKLLERPLDDEEWQLLRDRVFGMPECRAVRQFRVLLSEQYGKNVESERLVDERMLFLERSGISPSVEPHIPEILEYCGPNDVCFGVNTSSGRRTTVWMLHRAGLLERFFSRRETLITADDMIHTDHFKPSKLSWNLLWHGFGLTAKTGIFLALEDSLTNVVGAVVSHRNVLGIVLAEDDAVYQTRIRDLNKYDDEIRNRIRVVRSFRPVLEFLREHSRALEIPL